MKRGLQIVTLVQVEPDHSPEIAERLREFTTDRGVQVQQVFPVNVEHQPMGIGALVSAPSQTAMDWFGSIVTSYAGVKSLSELASCTYS